MTFSLNNHWNIFSISLSILFTFKLGMFYLLHYINFKSISLFEVIIFFKCNTTFKTFFNFFSLIFTSLNWGNFCINKNFSITNNSYICIIFNYSISYINTCNITNFRKFKYLSYNGTTNYFSSYSGSSIPFNAASTSSTSL